MQFSRISLFVFIAVLWTSCARNPVTGKKEISLMSEAQEIAMGQEYDPQIVAEYGLYSDQKLQDFINQKGNEMVAISHRPNLKFSFKILDSPIANAFAVPGGYVYFTRGIMCHFNNEAEFAGVLGHEAGHITARHANASMKKQVLTQGVLLGGMILSKDVRRYGDAAMQGAQLFLLSHSRKHESQSDELGVEYSTKVGYDAREMAGFFKTLGRLSNNEGGGRIPEFMSTHPDPGNRFTHVGELATQAQKALDVSTLKINRENYLKMIDGLMYGEDPKQGYVENNVFYHPELKFQFPLPKDWRTQNSPSKFQAAPQDGKALLILTLAQGSDLESAKAATINKNKLTVIETTDIKVNGLNAIALLSDINPVSQNGQPAQGEPLKILTYLIEHNKMIYELNGLSTKNDFNLYFSSFQGSMKNFRVLVDQSKIDKKPMYIKIVTAKSATTLQQLMNDNNIPSNRQNEVAILNGMEYGTSIPAGMMVKMLTGSM
jgi:predicted Zn-dependent protease